MVLLTEIRISLFCAKQKFSCKRYTVQSVKGACYLHILFYKCIIGNILISIYISVSLCKKKKHSGKGNFLSLVIIKK
jgi:hypothetical protein